MTSVLNVTLSMLYRSERGIYVRLFREFHKHQGFPYHKNSSKSFKHYMQIEYLFEYRVSVISGHVFFFGNLRKSASV